MLLFAATGLAYVVQFEAICAKVPGIKFKTQTGPAGDEQVETGGGLEGFAGRVVETVTSNPAEAPHPPPGE